MCLVLFAAAAHPRHSLVLAANRDEFHARPAATAAWVEPGLLAGRDLEAGGTWLALRRDGRFAVVTNVREPGRAVAGAPSRGALPFRVVKDRRPLAGTLAGLSADLAACNGCNLLAGSATELWSASNRGPGPQPVAPGVHGLSNHLLDTPWPKLVHGKARLAAWLEGDGADPEPLFSLLGDRTLAADADLPRTGVPLDWERRLSAAFIVSPEYGTRCSTVLLLGRDGTARFIERSFDPDGGLLGEVDQSFPLGAP